MFQPKVGLGMSVHALGRNGKRAKLRKWLAARMSATSYCALPQSENLLFLPLFIKHWDLMGQTSARLGGASAGSKCPALAQWGRPSAHVSVCSCFLDTRRLSSSVLLHVLSTQSHLPCVRVLPLPSEALPLFILLPFLPPGVVETEWH